MSELPVSRLTRWRQRLRRIGARARAALPFALGVVAALVALLLYRALVPGPAPLTDRDVNASIARAFASATAPPAFSARVYQAIHPSFVLIQTQETDASGKSGRGIGSGVIITDRADILTALHVVAEATAIQVTFADGSQSPAQVAGTLPESDIAVLRPLRPPAAIVPATLGNPGSMRVGDEVFALGNPFGLYDSLSSGIISGFDRSFKATGSDQRLQGLIQFDAAVNPGNSGGPLLNREGQVIGIVTGLGNPTDQNFFVGIGFAVPINIAGGAAGLPPY